MWKKYLTQIVRNKRFADKYLLIISFVMFLLLSCCCSCDIKAGQSEKWNFDVGQLKISKDVRQIILIAIDSNNEKSADLIFKDSEEKSNENTNIKTKLESEIEYAQSTNHDENTDNDKNSSEDDVNLIENDMFDWVDVYKRQLQLSFEPSIDFGVYYINNVFGCDDKPNIAVEYSKVFDEVLVDDSQSKMFGQLTNKNTSYKDWDTVLEIANNKEAFSLGSTWLTKKDRENQIGILCCESDEQVAHSIQIPKEFLLNILYYLSNNCALIVDYKENIANY